MNNLIQLGPRIGSNRKIFPCLMKQDDVRSVSSDILDTDDDFALIVIISLFVARQRTGVSQSCSVGLTDATF